MSALIVYDSKYGNTKKVAESVAGILKAKVINVAEFNESMLQGVDLLIVGSPIQGWRPTQAITNFLNSLPKDSLKGVKTAAFDTRIKTWFSGSANDKIEAQLKKLGGESILPPAKFIVEASEGPLAAGEQDISVVWANEIKKIIS